MKPKPATALAKTLSDSFGNSLSCIGTRLLATANSNGVALPWSEELVTPESLWTVQH